MLSTNLVFIVLIRMVVSAVLFSLLILGIWYHRYASFLLINVFAQSLILIEGKMRRTITIDAFVSEECQRVKKEKYKEVKLTEVTTKKRREKPLRKAKFF